VITDLTMPNLPGNKLAAQMIAMHPRTPIILTTGYGSEMSDAKTKDLGFKALLIKPIDKKQLAETVRQVLNSVEKNEP
jgi:DNA-binding NtrC family response regulator